MVGHRAKLKALGATHGAGDGGNGTITSCGGGEAIAPIQPCGGQRVDKGHGSCTHDFRSQRFHQNDDDIGSCRTRFPASEIGREEGVGRGGALQRIVRVGRDAPFGMGGIEVVHPGFVIFGQLHSLPLVESRPVVIFMAVGYQIVGLVQDIVVVPFLYQMRHLEDEREQYHHPRHNNYHPCASCGMLGTPQAESCKSSYQQQYQHHGFHDAHGSFYCHKSLTERTRHQLAAQQIAIVCDI